MNVENESKLSKNALKDLFTLEIQDKRTYSVEYILQVIGIRLNESAKSSGKNNSIYTASLSDGEFKYTGFVIFREEADPEIIEGDIILVIKVCPAKLNTQKNRVFIVKKYAIVEKNAKIEGNLEMLKEETIIDKIKIENNDTIKIEVNNDTITNTTLTTSASQTQSDSGNSTITSKQKITYMPLQTLTTFSKDIKILVRCLKKTSIRSFNGGQGGSSGSLFSFNVIDKEGSEMQITCFNKACEKFFNTIKENSVYEILGGYIKPNDKKYTCVKSDYTMIIYENAKINELEDDGSIKETHHNFVKISEIQNIQPNSIIDILAYVIEAPEKIMKVTKIGEQPIRKIIIGDDSEYKIEFTLWKHFTDLTIQSGDVISVKSVKIGDYNGRSLSTVDHSMISIDPALKETSDLKNFCQNFKEEYLTFNETIGGGVADASLNMPTLTIREVLSMLDANKNANTDKIPISKIKATICTITHSEKNFYPGCPDKTCKKKLYFQEENNQWSCNNCHKTALKPFYYYRFSVRIKDYSGEHWLDIFGDFGNKLFKMNCEEYKDLVFGKNEDKLNDLTNSLEFRKFYFVVKPMRQEYNNISKKKLNCYKLDSIDSAEEAKRILKSLNTILNKQ